MPAYNYKRLYFGGGIAVLIALSFIYFFLLSDISVNYLPIWNDEFFYYTNAFSFFENNNLRAALTFSGGGSRLMGADAHGFAYPLLNGGVAKVFGWNSKNFICLNFLFVTMALLIIWLQQTFTPNQKILISVIALLFPFFAIYGFTYMQESIHIFFAVVCAVLIHQINLKGKARYFYWFILIVLLASLFRPFWLFWLIGLIPFAKNKLQTRYFILLFLLGGILSACLMYFFSEYLPNYFATVITLIKQGRIGDFAYSMARHFTYNGYAYFFKNHQSIVYFLVKIINLGVLAYFIYKAFITRSNLFIAIALIGFFNFLMLFLLYDVFLWRETRVLAAFFYFCIPFVVTKVTPVFKFILLAVLVIAFIFTLPVSKHIIAERNLHTKNEIGLTKNAFYEIAKKVADNKLIFINYYPSDSTLDLISLPVKNVTNSPIKYIVPYYKVKKLNYDYILNLPNTPPVGDILISNQYYQLEKIGK